MTYAMVSVEGEALRAVTWVTIEEVASGEWGVGGKALRTGDVAGDALWRVAPDAHPSSPERPSFIRRKALRAALR